MNRLAVYEGDLNSRATRKKLVATANRREGVYNRTGEPSVTFCERGGARKRSDGLFFCRRQKNKPEQSGLCSGVSKPHEKDLFGISTAGVELFQTRKKLVASRSAQSAFTSEQRRRSGTFCGKGGTVERSTDFLSIKKSERA